MAQQRGPSYGMGVGGPSSFGGPSSQDTTESNLLDTVRQYTSKIEDMLDTLSEPVKP